MSEGIDSDSGQKLIENLLWLLHFDEILINVIAHKFFVEFNASH